jgi:FkbM family methyltransferase
MSGDGGARYYRLRLNPGFFAHLFKAVFKQHHKGLMPLLRGLVPEDAVVLDVGAHAGQFTKLFARLAPKGFVYAVEPQSYARAILRTALALNRIGNAAVLPLALGERPGVGVLRLPVKASGSFGFGLAHLGGAGAGNEVIEAVAVTTLDALVAALGLARLDFIKADIEGYETHFIEGARQSLARFRPALLIEHDPARLDRAGSSNAALWQALSNLGYRAHEPTEARVPIAAPRGGDVLWLA